jgi:hypothetical protein
MRSRVYINNPGPLPRLEREGRHGLLFCYSNKIASRVS